MKIKNLLFIMIALLSVISCSSDDDWTEPGIPIDPEPVPAVLYVLNEGKWGANNSTLSYYNYETGEFVNDYFGKVNPSQGGLGDVGNDLKIYGSKMYAVINNSNYVEVMDANTAEHIGQIQILNGRSIIFDKGFAYISSFAGEIQPGGGILGTINKVDTASLNIIGKVTVGYQPEEMAIINDKLYVTNSGGYTPANYDNTISVIDLNSFQETEKISVGPNPWRIRADINGKLWVTSRGDGDTPPTIKVIDPTSNTITHTLNMNVTNFDFYGNKIYYYSTEWTGSTSTNSYGVINIVTKTKTSEDFLGNIASQLNAPYGILINQENGDIFIGDAKNYENPGILFCLDKNGNLKWERTTGISPGHFAFLMK